MERRVEESVYGVQPKGRSIFPALGPPTKIALAEYKGKQGTENVEDGKALLFTSAKSCNSFF